MKKIRLKLDKNRSYDIIVGYKIIPRLSTFLGKLKLGKEAIIITDDQIKKVKYHTPLIKSLKSSGYTPYVITIPGRETSKSFKGAVNLIERIAKIDKGGDIFILALGGGMTGDLTGYVASAYKRGVPYIQIPTTLLAQVDSAIGGKTAVDLPFAKNIMGAFYQPRLVISDIKFLEKMPRRIFRSGLGEVIKYGIIKDKILFEFLEKNIYKILNKNKKCLEYIIYRSSQIKAKIVQKDEYDQKGIRAKLNYGHTIGHAIETASNYSRFYYHGEAIAIGMVIAAKIAKKMGILKETFLERIIKLIKNAGLPTRISKKLKTDKIMKAQAYDKKIIRGVNRFVLPTKIGEVKIYEDIPKRLILECLKTR